MKAMPIAKPRRRLGRLRPKTAKQVAVATTLLEQLAAFDGLVTDAPPDLAVNHEHYRLGTPKRA